MTPAELAKSKTEHAEQRAFFAWLKKASAHGLQAADDERAYTDKGYCDYSYPTRAVPAIVRALVWAHAVHNQGHGDKIRGGRAKAEGVKAGIPDICVPIPCQRYAGLYIEMKTVDRKPKKAGAKGGLSDDQIDAMKYLRSVGYCAEVAYGWREAAQVIRLYIQEAMKNG